MFLCVRGQENTANEAQEGQSPKVLADQLHNDMYFEIVGEIDDIETMAVGGKIRDIMKLRKQFGPARWRKMKGTAKIRLEHDNVRLAEIHWYEGHGIGRRKMKIKRLLD